MSADMADGNASVSGQNLGRARLLPSRFARTRQNQERGQRSRPQNMATPGVDLPRAKLNALQIGRGDADDLHMIIGEYDVDAVFVAVSVELGALGRLGHLRIIVQSSSQ